jgi:hypothetical protein
MKLLVRLAIVLFALPASSPVHAEDKPKEPDKATKVSEDGVELLRLALPDLKIIR